MRRLSAIGSWLVMFQLSGCISFGDELVRRRAIPESEEEVALITDKDATAPRSDAGSLSADPHAVLGLEPSHGPFAGGQLTLIRGNGFGSDVAVWFGDTEVDSLGVVPVDAKRLQVQVPPGARGSVDVIIQNGDDRSTRRVLKDGYKYDDFFVTPGSGSTNGGNIVTLVGDRTGWTKKSRVLFDLKRCELLEVRTPKGEPEELDCRVPPGTPGRKPVSVETPDGERQMLSGGYSYSDSENGFEGGLSGESLDGELNVLALNGFSGERLSGATVLAGTGPSVRATTDKTGRAIVGDLGEVETVTLTVAMPCMQPLTLIDVPVENATVYLDPVLEPACIPPIDDIPNVPGGGGGVSRTESIRGELAFGLGVEYKRGGWLNVPQPRTDNEELVAYVFELSSSPSAVFRLPSRGDAITPAVSGTLGYNFRHDTRSSGNLTLYAFAGIERSNAGPRQFTPYAFGLLKGVSVDNSDARPFIPMNLSLDHAVTIEVEGPTPTRRGPDRVEVDLALRVGRSGFVPLPRSRDSVLLPVTDPLRFVGVPQLAGSLTGAEYITSARAVSGAAANLPWSELEARATRSSDTTVPVTDFVEVPVLVEPGVNLSWGGRELELDWAAGGSRVDLLVIDVSSAGGSFRWRIVAPGDRKRVKLPDLSQEPGLGLAPGRINISVSAARITDFDYATLRERDFSPRGWTAYATDNTPAFLP